MSVIKKSKKNPNKIKKPKKFAASTKHCVWAKIRKRLDLTQVEMAEKITGCTQPWLYQVESERSVPSILFVMRACRNLNVDIREIERYYRKREKHFEGPLS